MPKEHSTVFDPNPSDFSSRFFSGYFAHQFGQIIRMWVVRHTLLMNRGVLICELVYQYVYKVAPVITY